MGRIFIHNYSGKIRIYYDVDQIWVGLSTVIQIFCNYLSFAKQYAGLLKKLIWFNQFTSRILKFRA